MRLLQNCCSFFMLKNTSYQNEEKSETDDAVQVLFSFKMRKYASFAEMNMMLTKALSFV